jgi:hypothetical protein
MAAKKSKKREKNLIPFNKRTENEQRKIAKKGGKASGKVRGAIKSFKEMLIDISQRKGKRGINKQELAEVLYQMGLSGNLKAIEMLVEYLGEKPIERHSLEASLSPKLESADLEVLKTWRANSCRNICKRKEPKNELRNSAKD